MLYSMNEVFIYTMMDSLCKIFNVKLNSIYNMEGLVRQIDRPTDNCSIEIKIEKQRGDLYLNNVIINNYFVLKIVFILISILR